ncbi:MAG: hypothetical protein JWM32_1174 [Verrucomicrobia bacterium]|nr:hypothetical protein [Verrucomicrobiota bacterium]
MRFPRFFAALVIFAPLASSRAQEAAPPKPTPDSRFGNVLYKSPDASRWTMTDLGDRRVYSAKLPLPDFSTLTVFTGGKLQGDFDAAFDRAINSSLGALRSSKIERDGGVQASKSAEGFDVRQRIVVAVAPEFHTYHWFLAAHSGDRFDLIAFQTSSEEMYQQYGQDAANFFYSVKLANSLPPIPALPTAMESAPRAAEPVQPAVSTIAAPKTTRSGPLGVGDRVEIPWGGGWVPGTVLYVDGLTYFVHYRSDSDADTYDDFFTLNLIRPPGGPQTYAESFRGTLPDPSGGPIALGTPIEYYDGRWNPGRVARRIGERYEIFADKPGSVTERWVTPDKLRPAGSTTAYAPERPFQQRRPATAAEIQPGDLVTAKPRRGSWIDLTVLEVDGPRYFVKIGPDSGLSLRSWVGLSKMRAVGAKEPFQAEDLNFFVGTWRLTGDSFQNLVDRKVSGAKVTETYQNNSGAGQDAGGLVIKADGTYDLRNTVVHHDGRGRWERNPDQDEGGILLRGADGEGDKDCVVTNHLDGNAYFQGSFRGPGKWCTRVGK